MLARSSIIRHQPTGVTLQTPLLVPSFSSKGFARSKSDGKSEIGKILATASEFITESYLVSAYDIHYGDLQGAPDLPCTPELIFLDSGGYEVSTDRDYSAVVDSLPAPQPWDLEKWESVVNGWPEEIPLVVVSYDHHEERVSFSNQVANARQRFVRCNKHICALLLKPETKSQLTLESVLKSAIANTEELGSFDLVGVTEKELGKTMLDRMVQIATLRRAMDESGVTAPIHVFGALDPISVCLYYLSGAEVFDGLTWIRYAYDNGRCIYTHNHGVLRYGLHVRDDAVKSRALAENYYALQDLQRRLREFEATKNYDKLEPHGKLISDAHDSLVTRMKRRA